MGFPEQYIQALARVITGGSGDYSPIPSIGIYRKAYEIEEFFLRLGYEFDWEVNIYRIPATQYNLQKINEGPDGVERIKEITIAALDPRYYVNNEEKLNDCIEFLNKNLRYESLKIYFDGEKVAMLSSAQNVPAVEALEDYFDVLSLDHCREDMERALRSVESDPTNAIAAACAMVESVAKAILDKTGTPYPTQKTIVPLVSEAMRALGIHPKQQEYKEIKTILGGLTTVSDGIGSLRTKFSSAHGRGVEYAPLDVRHARLCVNASATVALFLIDTFKSEGQM